MAIDPYKPELAKRQTAFEMALQQLQDALDSVSLDEENELRQRLAEVFEAMEDYRQTSESLAEWMEQHQGQPR